MMRALVLSIGVLVALAGSAAGYPQFQISRDQTCTSCHLSPAGGGLLNENGLNLAEAYSQWGTKPEFLNGAWTPPSWLALGGDFRGMAGYYRAPQQYLALIPMQGDVYARATKDKLAFVATVGIRPAQEGNEAATRVWSREHYLEWQSDPGAREGIWVRLGHLMPVFGLRFAEHPVYTRRYGGTQLFSETYGGTVSYIKEAYEVHASGFVEDPLIDGVRVENGGAVYGEARLAEHTQVGAGGMIEANDWLHRYRATLTAKQFLPTPGLLVQGEVQFVNPVVGGTWTNGKAANQVVSYLMTSYYPTDAVMVDLGLGYYTENLDTQKIGRCDADLNVHWFVSSHFEALLVSHYEQIGIYGHGGPTGEWLMLQGHYRL